MSGVMNGWIILLAIVAIVLIVQQLNKLSSEGYAIEFKKPQDNLYCPPDVEEPMTVDDGFVAYCTSLCQQNGTLMPELCPCACARSRAFIM
jgi:hypothetical protein